MRVITFTTLVVICGCLTAAADEPERGTLQLKLKTKDHPTSFWMEQKMSYSQAILRGLAMGELDEVAINAEQMQALSQIEGFFRRKEPGYPDQLQAFDFAAKEVVRYAKAGKLEAAAMAYQQLTYSCVSCHALLRDPPLAPVKPARTTPPDRK